MTGLPRDYDKWRTRGDWEDQEDAERKRKRDEDLMERADYERDREKDEPDIHNFVDDVYFI